MISIRSQLAGLEYERVRRKSRQVKVSDSPGANGTTEVNGDNGSASSTVGGRKARPWPLALCQSPFWWSAMECVVRCNDPAGWSEQTRPSLSSWGYSEGRTITDDRGGGPGVCIIGS
jgi:hypothetical protein